MMKTAIMQPYFFPYIGYFQLLNAVDKFVVYDNIKYTKKGWINRNRILVNGVDHFISLPIRKDSDFLNVNDRYLADTWGVDRGKMLNRIKDSYRKAPYFKDTFTFVEQCLLYNDKNLFNFLIYSLQCLMDFLNIQTELIVSSEISIDHNLKGVDKVVAICQELESAVYINPIGGQGLYEKHYFEANGLKLFFHKSDTLMYPQLNNEFVPWLSIIDVLMFNGKEGTTAYLKRFKLL